MKRLMKSVCAALTATCLLAGSASAGLIPALDSAISEYFDINTEVRFALGVELKTLMPFQEATVEMLNGVLSHLRVNAAIAGGEGDVATNLQLQADERELFSLSQSEGEAGSSLTTSLLPNRTLSSKASAMDALSGKAAEEEQAFDALAAIAEADGCYTALTDAIAPYAVEKKASYKIAGIGSSRWSRIARLTPEQSAELAPLIAAVLGCGMDQPYREQLEALTYGKGFVVGLYQSEQDGVDMAVYMKGSVTFPDGGTGKLAYQWAFAPVKSEKGERRKDTYRFELSRAKGPADKRVIGASYDRSQEAGTFSLNGECEVTLKNAEGTKATTVSHELSGAQSNGVRSLEGTLSATVKETAGERTKTTLTTFAPKLSLSSAEGAGALSGTVDVTEKKNKNTTLDILLTFDEEPSERLIAAAGSGELYAVTEGETGEVSQAEPQGSLWQNEDEVTPASGNEGLEDYLVGTAPIGLSSYTAPQSMINLDLDVLTAEQRESLLDEMAQNLAGKLLIALAALPQADIALLRDGMTDEDYAAFMTLIEGL